MAKKTYIHVNQHVIRRNLKTADNQPKEPPITVKNGRKNQYCFEVKILGESTVRYGDDGQPILSCGARVVIETEAEVEIIK